MMRLMLPSLCALSLLSGPVLADGVAFEQEEWATVGVVESPIGGNEMGSGGAAFTRLSNGNRMIARALFAAQPDGVRGAMSLEQIAAARLDGSGWGRLFKHMKSRGLVREENLGQVISRHNRRRAVLAESREDDQGSQFDRLSPGNKKIAISLYDAQQNERKNMSLEDIAAAKRDGSGWSRIFRHLKSDGLVAENNIGQVISRYARGRMAARSNSETGANRGKPRSRVKPIPRPRPAPDRMLALGGQKRPAEVSAVRRWRLVGKWGMARASRGRETIVRRDDEARTLAQNTR